MATRFYPRPTTPAPTVSPAYDAGVWDETAAALRRQLIIDTPDNVSGVTNTDTDTIAGVGYYLLWQFVSEPLDAISATLAVSKAAFRCSEENAKLNAFTHIVFRKCDEDGANPVTIGSITDDVEWDNDYDTSFTNRFVGASNLTDQALSQGDRLVIEVGFYSSATKAGGYIGGLVCQSGPYATDLGENDTDTDAWNSWIETGDTFTEATGGGALSINVSDGLTAAQGLD